MKKLILKSPFGRLWLIIAAATLAAALPAAIACGGDPEVVTEVHTVVVEKQLPGQTVKVVETVVVERSVTEIQRVVETVVVEKSVTEIQKVIETVVVQREVEGKTVTVVETVVVERPVTRIEKVVETVVVEKPVTRIEKVVETVVVEKAVTQVQKVVETVVVVATPTTVQPFMLRAPQTDPKRGGIVRTAWPVNPAHQDLHQSGQAHVLSSLHNLLIRRDPLNGYDGLIGDLAVGWTIDPDFLGYTFQLREGVQFHDGSPFSADDVVATFDRILNPPEGVAIIVEQRFSGLSGVEAVSPTEVRFTLSAPFTWQFDMFSATDAVIYSKKQLEETGGDLRGETAIGTGPFITEEAKPGEFWLYEANPNYWNPELPYVDGIRLIHAGGPQRGPLILSGQADFSFNVLGDSYAEGLKRHDIEVRPTAAFGHLDVMWNNEKEPFTDKKFRQALRLAVNAHDVQKVALIQLVLTRWIDPRAEGAQSVEWPDLPGYREDSTEDIETARRLLAEAGYPNGEGLRKLEFISPTRADWLEILAPYYVDQLKQALNIDLEIVAMERSQVVEALKQDYDMALQSGVHNPIANFAPMFHEQWTCGAAQNYSRWCNPDYDAIVARLNVEPDPVERETMVQQLLNLLDEDPPSWSFGYVNHRSMWHNYVKGFGLAEKSVSEWGRFETVWLDK